MQQSVITDATCNGVRPFARGLSDSHPKIIFKFQKVCVFKTMVLKFYNFTITLI